MRVKTADMLDAIRARHPLIHNITNYVAMNFTANALLSLGASPVMAHALEEVEEMVGMAGALVINMGTLSGPWINSMFQAGYAARRRGLPIVLDPVGAGATRLRTETTKGFIQEIHPNVVRGNASEILAVVGRTTHSKGLDSADGLESARTAAAEFATLHATVIAITGAEDFITDGRRSAVVANGHPLMSRITGAGCAATAILGAFCAVESDPFLAAAGALVYFGIAGELAAQSLPRPGTFQTQLLDALDEVDRRHIEQRARVTIS